MRCTDLDDLLSAYADGETMPAQSEFLKAHLDACERCRQVARGHHQTRMLLKSALPDTWTPPDLTLRVTLALRKPTRRRRPAAIASLAGVAVASLLLTGVIGVRLAANGSPDGSMRISGAQSPQPGSALVASTVPGAAQPCANCVVATSARGRLPVIKPSVVFDVRDSSPAYNPATFPPLPPGWPSSSVGSKNLTSKGGGAPHKQLRALTIRVQPL